MTTGRCEETEKIENLLYGYPQLVAEINLRLLDHREGAPIRAVSFEEPYTSPTNKFFSVVEVGYNMMDRLDEELVKKIKARQWIDTALECLTDKELIIVNMRYWKKLELEEIASRFDVSRRTISNYRTQILSKLSKSGLADMDFIPTINSRNVC